MLFKLFNKIETWELISREFGEVDLASFDARGLGSVLANAMDRGEAIYSAAYIMPPASTFGSPQKHENHLRMLERMLLDRVHERVVQASSMMNAYETLLEVPSIGPFLAYQLITDLNYSPFLHFSEQDFVVPGPGAMDGLRKCFATFGDLSPADVVRWTMDTQREHFARHSILFDDLWDRSLQLVDCQNLYCEIDKYARVAFPALTGRSHRKRIKQRYRPRDIKVTAWYPPKWGLNDRVERWLSKTVRFSRGPTLGADDAR